MGLVRGVFFIALFTFGHTAAAQSLPPPGTPAWEPQFREAPPPKAQTSSLIRVPSTLPPEQADAIHLVLKRIVVEGTTVYAPADLESLWAALIGREVSVADIYAVRDRIRQKYSDDGWLLAIPLILEQQTSPRAAVIRIRVIEAYINRVAWPDVLATYRDLFSECSQKILAERPARLATVERCLLLARDLPGLKIGSTLKRSDEGAGATTLVIDVEEKPFEASVHTDNRTQQGRGPNEVFASGTANNLLGQHEAITATYGSAYNPDEFLFVEGAYKQVLTSDGLTLNAVVNYTTGRPHIPTLGALGYVNTGLTSEVGLTYPVIRAREQNLWIGGVFFTEDTQSTTTAGMLTNDRLRGLRLRLNADEADTVLGTAGVTQVFAIVSQGIDGLGSMPNGNPQAGRINGRVDFTKAEGTISRTQALAAPFSVFLAAYGQTTGEPLPIPEQCGYGGRFFGRAFDPFQLTGDQCVSALGEVRFDLPILTKELTMAQLYGFADHGVLFRNDPSVGTAAEVTGTSAGAGVRFSLFDKLDVDLQAAKPIEGRSDNDWRFFFSVSAKY